VKKPEWLRVGSDNFEFCSLEPSYTPLGDIARIYSYEAFETTETGKRSLGVFRSLRAAQAAVEGHAARARNYRSANQTTPPERADYLPAEPSSV
jgi:hypothetical protein